MVYGLWFRDFSAGIALPFIGDAFVFQLPFLFTFGHYYKDKSKRCNEKYIKTTIKTGSQDPVIFYTNWLKMQDQTITDSTTTVMKVSQCKNIAVNFCETPHNNFLFTFLYFSILYITVVQVSVVCLVSIRAFIVKFLLVTDSYVKL